MKQESVPASKALSPSEQAKLDWLRAAVQEGLDEIDRGEGILLNTVDEMDALVGIRRGLADVEAGRVTTLRRFEREFRKKHGLPGRSPSAKPNK
ncbi:MAG TPA: hypothetical protein PKJ41_19350 [Bryobacteraceae bacterium]|nr:hypothetical protein [Bryobacteraceae bacterium]HPT28266.1 hypothetical protein [Bryobacteraceae bacterium]